MKPFMVSNAQLQEFFDMLRVGPEELCWEWEGYLSKRGYPILGEEGQFKKAHRIAFLTAYPNLAYRMTNREVHHTCYNSVCVNAGHMQLVSQREHQRLTTRDHFEKIDQMRRERGVTD